jgi:hypothetical protein
MSSTFRIRKPQVHPAHCDDAPALPQDLSDRQPDREESRWQLEWVRRNVED